MLASTMTTTSRSKHCNIGACLIETTTLISTHNDHRVIEETAYPASASSRWRSSANVSADTRQATTAGPRSVQDSGTVTDPPAAVSKTRIRAPPRLRANRTRNRRPDRGWNGCVTTTQSPEQGPERDWALCSVFWESAWAEFVPFLAFDVEIRKVICSTNAIESVNARIRKAVRARGHFPNEQAALKCVYMALMSLDPTGAGRRRWTMRWKAPLNAFQIAFEGRLTPATY